MINIIEKQIINLDTDFDKYFSKIIKKCIKIDNEIESHEVEYQRALRHNENYKYFAYFLQTFYVQQFFFITYVS